MGVLVVGCIVGFGVVGDNVGDGFGFFVGEEFG